MQVRKQQLELDMGQQTGSQIGKGVHQGCIFPVMDREAWHTAVHGVAKIQARHAYLTYMQSTLCEMPG